MRAAPPRRTGSRRRRSREPEFEGDAAKLYDILDRGMPVLVSKIGQLMAAAGSAAIVDETTFKAWAGKAPGKAALDELDLEVKPGGRLEDPSTVYYVIWRGWNPKVHRGGTRKPGIPDKECGRVAVNALQASLDRALAQGAGKSPVPLVTRRLEGRALGGEKAWSQGSEDAWKRLLAAMLPAPEGGSEDGAHFRTLNHEFAGQPLRPLSPGDAGSAFQERWVLGRLRFLAELASTCQDNDAGGAQLWCNQLKDFALETLDLDDLRMTSLPQAICSDSMASETISEVTSSGL